MDVAIFGAGIAGLMAGITLHAQGHHCRIYERTFENVETGMGFILMPEGIDCMKSFGVQLTGDLSGVPLLRYCCRNEAGQILHEQTLPAGTRSFQRRDLIAALLRALPSNGTVTFGTELESLEFNETGCVAAARLKSGKSGTRTKAGLYVAAEGVRSKARQALFPDWAAPQARVLEIVGLVRCDNTIRWAGHDFNKFHASSGGIALGVLPVAAHHVVWYLQFDAERFPPPGENAAARRAFVKKLTDEWADPVPHLLAMTDFSRVHVWRPIDTDLVPHFHQCNLVLAGDAAHPLLPFTSQGVSSAIADAVALANLVRSSVRREDDLAQALARYSAERHQQCAPYIAKGRELARRFLAPLDSSTEVLPWVQ